MLAYLERGLRQQRLVQCEELAALVRQNQGTITLRDLRDRHGCDSPLVLDLVAVRPDLLKVATFQPATGRPSERLELVA